MTKMLKSIGWWSTVMGLALSVMMLPTLSAAQDEQDDPPTRVARLGYMEGSVSFQPAGEDDWVQAVPNRPMTTGDKLWADKDSRVELQLGSAVIRLNENTGFSFLNLDDNTIQIQLTAGSINVRLRRLEDNDDFEVDTPNLAFTASQPGSYRVEASDDGTYTVVGIRDGGGQATGNGQTYTVHAGQRATFSGTDSLNADVVDIGAPDPFDTWAYERDHRYDQSRSAHYLAADVVGFEDLDDHGDWRDDSNYGHVWFPNGVEAGWAPYHTGHWDWIEPWGYTWVDDSPWGYAPFHYGRWVTIDGRWGWVAGPVEVRAVYAPALVVFIGGGVGVGFGGNVGWFPLGPREVYVPPYQVSRGYMTQINISNTTVNTTVVTNVYNTTIINKSTNITNVTYVNRSVQGAVMVVPQHAFASAQPVASVAVRVNAAQLASVPVSARVAVVPTQQAVLGARASTAGHVAAPPAAVMNRQVIARKTPPPPPVSFAKQQQALAAHPGQAPARSEMQTLRPAASAASHPAVKVAPPGRTATPTAGRPGSQSGNQQNAGRPAPNGAPQNEPGNRPMNQPANRPAASEPSRTEPNQPAPANRPETNRPTGPENNRPNAPASQPEANRPETNRRAEPPARNDRPPSAQPNARPENTRPEANRPTENRPEENRPATSQPAPNRNEPAARPQTPPAAEREQRSPAPAARPAPAPQKPPAKAQTPAEKKQQEEEEKKKPPQL